MHPLHGLLQSDRDQDAEHNRCHVQQELAPAMNSILRRMNLHERSSLFQSGSVHKTTGCATTLRTSPHNSCWPDARQYTHCYSLRFARNRYPRSQAMTLHDALLEASATISRRDAETLLAHVLQRDRAWLLAHTDDNLPAPELDKFRSLVGRRAAQHPLQHLTGMQEFFGLTLRVTPDVLIPRPETEHLVEAVIDFGRRQPDPHLRIADVGTGSGAIAIALATVLEHAALTAIDISPAALAVARDNAE